MTYLDVRRSGTFLEKQQESECTVPIAYTDRRMTEHSTSDSLGDVSWIQKAALQQYRKGMCHSSTHPGMSFHVTQFYQDFPCVSNASAGLRRPGYEAMHV